MKQNCKLNRRQPYPIHTPEPFPIGEARKMQIFFSCLSTFPPRSKNRADKTGRPSCCSGVASAAYARRSCDCCLDTHTRAGPHHALSVHRYRLRLCPPPRTTRYSSSVVIRKRNRAKLLFHTVPGAKKKRNYQFQFDPKSTHLLKQPVSGRLTGKLPLSVGIVCFNL